MELNEIEEAARGATGPSVADERERLQREATAEHIDEANAADFLRVAYRQGFPSRARVEDWNQQWSELGRRALREQA